jgi:predicted nucleic acid-binding protein
MLIDTDVLIWYLRGHAKAAQLLDGLPDLRVSAVAWMELVQGCRNRMELGRLKQDFGRRRAQLLPMFS